MSRLPPCPKTTKASQQSVSWTRFLRSREPGVLFTTLLLKSQTSLQKDQILPPVVVKPWRTHKSTRGPMYNLTSRESNLTQRLQQSCEYDCCWMYYVRQSRGCAAGCITFGSHVDITAAECSGVLGILLLLNILRSKVMWILMPLNVLESYGYYCC